MINIAQFLTVLFEAYRFSEIDEALAASLEGRLWVARFSGHTYVREADSSEAVAADHDTVKYAWRTAIGYL